MQVLTAMKSPFHELTRVPPGFSVQTVQEKNRKDDAGEGTEKTSEASNMKYEPASRGESMRW